MILHCRPDHSQCWTCTQGFQDAASGCKNSTTRGGKESYFIYHIYCQQSSGDSHSTLKTVECAARIPSRWPRGVKICHVLYLAEDDEN
jgi:hypothetical protein